MLAERGCEQRIIGSCHPGNRIYCISKESSISLHNWKDFLLITWARIFFFPSIKSIWNNASCCAKAEQCGVVQRNPQIQHDRFCWIYQNHQSFDFTSCASDADRCLWTPISPFPPCTPRTLQLLLVPGALQGCGEHCGNNYCHFKAFKFV